MSPTRRLRVLLLPVLLALLGTWAVRSAAPPAPAAPAQEAAPLPPPLGALWQAWSADLVGEGAPFPTELAALEVEEALYVLMTVRAAQVAAAVQAAGADADVGRAVDAAGLGPSPEAVETSAVAAVPGCVVLSHEGEPLGRAYYGWAAAPEEPGPVPESPLEAVLLRTARVGLSPAEAATCGGGVAYSPAAQRALQALEPRLLSGSATS